jgi:hypothetical protein
VISVVINIFLVKGINLAMDKNEEYESWIFKLKNRLTSTYDSLKLIDEKHIFERDDEVGFVFSNIVELISDLNEKTYVEQKKENQS